MDITSRASQGRPPASLRFLSYPPSRMNGVPHPPGVSASFRQHRRTLTVLCIRSWPGCAHRPSVAQRNAAHLSTKDLGLRRPGHPPRTLMRNQGPTDVNPAPTNRAGGTVVTAFLQLRLSPACTSSRHRRKHLLLTGYGTTPTDHHTQDFVEVIRQAEPHGLDAVFDGVIWGYLDREFSLLQRGCNERTRQMTGHPRGSSHTSLA